MNFATLLLTCSHLRNNSPLATVVSVGVPSLDRCRTATSQTQATPLFSTYLLRVSTTRSVKGRKGSMDQSRQVVTYRRARRSNIGSGRWNATEVDGQMQRKSHDPYQLWAHVLECLKQPHKRDHDRGSCRIRSTLMPSVSCTRRA